jgi:septal ring factor EnvC (AmiA/AmiB activator)
MFHAMKRLFLAILVCAGIGTGPDGGFAQTPAPDAAATAERDYSEERYRRLNALIEQLANAQSSLQKRLGALAEESQRLRSELNNRPSNLATRGELRALERKLQELNDKREADKRLILEQLEKLLKKGAAPPAKSPAKTSPAKKNKPAKKSAA